jgi:hypothetical protein
MASKRQISTSVQVGIMASNSRHYSTRLRPEPDPIYLRQLAMRLADAVGLPLCVAKARVERMAISAGAPRDPGDLTRWLERGRRQKAQQRP